MRQVEEWIQADSAEGNNDIWYINQIYKKAIKMGEYSILLDTRLKLIDNDENLSLEVIYKT